MKNTQFKKTALISALLLATGAQAATIDVDGATCTLADAINAANADTASGGCTAGAGADVLELPVDGTFNLAGGTPNVTSAITINGNGTLIDGGAVTRIFTVQAGGDLTINDSIVTNGVSTYVDRNFGGGVRSYDGNLNINNSTFSNHLGGAVLFTRSTGSINNSVIDGNNSFGAAALYYGAGISISNSTVTIANSTISNNNTYSGMAGGGGLYITNFGGSSVDVINSTFSGNTSVNSGGGIGHLAYGGGGTNISLTNVTIVSNLSNPGFGGGLSNDAAVITISQSIISGNSNPVPGGAEINSTGGSVTLNDYNIIGGNGVSNVVGVTIGASDIVPMESFSEIFDSPLADNGGPTPTHALADGSPGIDAVPAASCASVSDQTGKARPLDGDGDMTADCDIGAFENDEFDFDLIFENGFE